MAAIYIFMSICHINPLALVLITVHRLIKLARWRCASYFWQKRLKVLVYIWCSIPGIPNNVKFLPLVCCSWVCPYFFSTIMVAAASISDGPRQGVFFPIAVYLCSSHHLPISSVDQVSYLISGQPRLVSRRHQHGVLINIRITIQGCEYFRPFYTVFSSRPHRNYYQL